MNLEKYRSIILVDNIPPEIDGEKVNKLTTQMQTAFVVLTGIITAKYLFMNPEYLNTVEITSFLAFSFSGYMVSFSRNALENISSDITFCFDRINDLININKFIW